MIVDGVGIEIWLNVRLVEIVGGVRGIGESEREVLVGGEIGEKVFFVGVIGDSSIGSGEIRDEVLLVRLLDLLR